MTKIEPSADHRTLAKFIQQMYVALMDEDFTEKQAIAIVAEMLAHMNRDA